MASASHGYEPARLAHLDGRTAAAVASLRAITSTDPAASDAMAALRRLRATLESGWVPAIRSIRRSTALSGAPAHAFGGGRLGWNRCTDGPEPGTLTFQPFVALSALFPGDDDVTGEEIATKIQEILDADPSEQQVLELGVLTNALEEIAMNTQLSADVIEALGPDGVTAFYARLHDLGYPYPVLPTPSHPLLEPDLRGAIEAFGLVVTQGVKRPGAAAVIEDVIETADEWPILRGVAPLAGLARVDRLPPDLADRLLEALRNLVDREHDLPNDTMRPTNVAYPGLPVRTESLIAVLFGGNPDLVTRHIYGPDGFVDGGEDLLGELIETDARNGIVGAEVSEALGSVIQRIIDQTPGDLLVVIDDRFVQTGEGVVFDIVQVLLDHDFKISGLGVVEALAPFLPVLTGAFPNSVSPFTPKQIGDLYFDLFNDMSTADVEAALAAILAGTLARFSDLDATEFSGGTRPDIEVGQLLDGVLGPATAAIERVVDGKEQQVAVWERAINQAFGLLPLPGGKLAGIAMRKAFSQVVSKVFVASDGDGQLEAADLIDVMAVEAALATIYASPNFHDEIVRNALDDWDRTAGSFRTAKNHPGATDADRRARDRVIADIKKQLERSLEPGAPPVDYEIFLALPEIRDVVIELRDKVTLSANGERSN